MNGWNKTHGWSRTPEYSSWVGMMQRCYTPSNTRWATRKEQSAGQRQSGNVRRIRAPIP